MAPSRRALAACVLVTTTAFRAPTIHRRRALVKHVEPAEAPIELCRRTTTRRGAAPAAATTEQNQKEAPPIHYRRCCRRARRADRTVDLARILLPWTPLFDTLSLVLLFLRSARET